MPVWTGSCPCQPFSCAGKGLGTADERHLWPEFKRLIDQCRPPIVFGEQVASAAGRLWLAGVRTDLERMGYAVGASDICAAGIGAPHIRQRLYWVAYTQSQLDGCRDAGTRRRAELTDSSDVSRLADYSSNGPQRNWQSPGTLPKWQGENCRGQRSSDNCPTGGLANLLQPGLERHAGHVHDGSQPGRIDPDQTGPTSEGGGAGGMEHPPSDVREQRWPEPSGRSVEPRCSSGYWSRYSIIPCRDGKARRIEPGTFPLAHGVPARVGRLRGYGNAIVPQVAEQFILAAMDAICSAHFSI